MKKTIKIEILFPEIANLYGDLQNIEYLRRSSADIVTVDDSLTEEPRFMTETPDLIYMGTLTEQGQELAKEKLRHYRERIEEMIADGVHFLITGNALEVFGSDVIEKKNGRDEVVFSGLNIYPTNARRDMMKRFNSLYLGTFDAEGIPKKDRSDDSDNTDTPIKIVGYKSQFTHSYWLGSGKYTAVPDSGYMFLSERGPGLNPDIVQEGIRINNFMATYVIGPLLVLNPPFTKWLLRELGAEDAELAFEKEAMEAYDIRVKEYSDPATGFYY